MADTEEAGEAAGGTRPEMVDDRYWLKRGTVFLDAAITARQDAAGRLVTATAWFWTVYTAVALVGTALADRSLSLGVALLIALPTLLLVAAYLVSVWATLPYDGYFVPNDPAAVEAAHTAAVEAKKSQLRLAFIAVSGAALSVLVAALTISLLPAEPAGTLALSVESTESGAELVVEGDFDADEQLVITVTEGPADGGAQVARELSSANGAGHLEEAVSFSTEADKARVVIAWTDDGKRDHEVSQVVEL